MDDLLRDGRVAGLVLGFAPRVHHDGDGDGDVGRGRGRGLVLVPRIDRGLVLVPRIDRGLVLVPSIDRGPGRGLGRCGGLVRR